MDEVRLYHYVSVADDAKPAHERLRVYLFEEEKQAKAWLISLLDRYGVPYEVWRALHGVAADNALPYAKQGITISMGMKEVKSISDRDPKAS